MAPSGKVMGTSNSHEGFQYIIERAQATKVCFGSGKSRTTIFGEVDKFRIGPQTYHCEDYTSGIWQFLNKKRSKKGVGGLISEVPRMKYKFERTPSPTRYDMQKQPVPRKDSHVPFGSKRCRNTLPVFSITPGAGHYNIRARQCRRVNFQENFGRRVKVHAVEEICVPICVDVCVKCGNNCGYDYWQDNYTTYLCHPCMAEERRLHEIFKDKQLNKFKKIRDCTYKHEHEGTTASAKKMTPIELAKRRRMEDYLALYVECFKTI